MSKGPLKVSILDVESIKPVQINGAVYSYKAYDGELKCWVLAKVLNGRIVVYHPEISRDVNTNVTHQ